jgi:hypothetical protein
MASRNPISKIDFQNAIDRTNNQCIFKIVQMPWLLQLRAWRLLAWPPIDNEVSLHGFSQILAGSSVVLCSMDATVFHMKSLTGTTFSLLLNVALRTCPSKISIGHENSSNPVWSQMSHIVEFARMFQCSQLITLFLVSQYGLRFIECHHIDVEKRSDGSAIKE